MQLNSKIFDFVNLTASVTANSLSELLFFRNCRKLLHLPFSGCVFSFSFKSNIFDSNFYTMKFSMFMPFQLSFLTCLWALPAPWRAFLFYRMSLCLSTTFFDFFQAFFICSFLLVFCLFHLVVLPDSLIILPNYSPFVNSFFNLFLPFLFISFTSLLHYMVPALIFSCFTL